MYDQFKEVAKPERLMYWLGRIFSNISAVLCVQQVGIGLRFIRNSDVAAFFPSALSCGQDVKNVVQHYLPCDPSTGRWILDSCFKHDIIICSYWKQDTRDWRKKYIFTKSARKSQNSNTMTDQNPNRNQEEDLDEKAQVVEPENAVQEREPGVPPPGTQHLKNPVQVVNMYRRQFSQEAVDFGVEWQKSKGERGSAPMFMRADLPGEWSTQGGKLFYTADGRKRELVPTEDVQKAIKTLW